MATDGGLQMPRSERTSETDSSKTRTTNLSASSDHQLPPTIASDGTPPNSSTKETLPTTSSPAEPPRDANNTTLYSLSPTLWPLPRKLTQTTLCCLITFLTGWNATALTASTTTTNTHFHLTDSATLPSSVWALTSWNLGAALAPMFILPVMEDHGTRPGYLLAYALFIGFVIPQPLVTSYAAFCSVRFLAGCAAGVLQTCMDGVIADVWADDVRMSRPVSCYVAALLAGVSSGPVMGAVVSGVGGLGWRWILWVQLIVYVVLVVPVWFLFRETRIAVIRGKVERRERKNAIGNFTGTISSIVERGRSARQPQPIEDAHSDSRSHPQSSVIAFLRGNILRPFHLLLTEPVVFSFTLLSALSYGITFLSTQSIPQVFSAVYAFSEPQTAYIQSAIVLGEITGWAICMWIQDPFFARAAQRAAADSDGIGRLRRSLPEKRLYAAVPASFVALAAGLFIYGFTSRPAISLYLPTFGLFLIGIGVVVVMQAIMMYVTDSYGAYAASASAAVCFGENVFASFLPLGSQGMYGRLGFGWASGLLGFVALLLGLGPVVLVFYGERVRGRSRFMGMSAVEPVLGE